jgi:HEAT repeat protein
MAMAGNARALLEAALASGSEASLAAWSGAGRAGVGALRDELAGVRPIDTPPGTHPRDMLDNLGQACAVIARAEPAAFLDVFTSDRWSANSFVLTGLGEIDDDRATARLIAAAGDKDWTVRMHVAIGLGSRPSSVGSLALGELLIDEEYPVRYHALRSLERVGLAVALPDLDRLRPLTDVERSMRDQAIVAIQARDAAPRSTG